MGRLAGPLVGGCAGRGEPREKYGVSGMECRYIQYAKDQIRDLKVFIYFCCWVSSCRFGYFFSL